MSDWLTATAAREVIADRIERAHDPRLPRSKRRTPRITR